MKFQSEPQPKAYTQAFVNNYDDNYLPTTLGDNPIKIPANKLYACMWVNVENEGDYGSGDGMIFCIFINNEWHQAQSIDFDFI
jgi:hypothetical protein